MRRRMLLLVAQAMSPYTPPPVSRSASVVPRSSVGEISSACSANTYVIAHVPSTVSRSHTIHYPVPDIAFRLLYSKLTFKSFVP